VTLRPHHLPYALLAAGGGVLSLLWLAGLLPATGRMVPQPAGAAGDVRERHFVTHRQLAGANTMTQVRVDIGWGEGDALPAWEELSGGLPVVLVFVKDGCPCSDEFEPFFQRVAQLYAGAVRFADVIDAPAWAARRYAQRHRVPYPVLADPGRRLIRRFRAENGGYVVLLSAGGAIDGYWPGCSADTMRDLGRWIARLAGLPECPLDVTGMPAPLTTGCPFEP
jgi:hypothetical protein